MRENFDVIVCGSGPAGLSASLECVRGKRRTLMLEKMIRPSCKLYATGGGRCNFSNTLDPVKFMASFGRSGRFMSEALTYTPREWVMDQLRGEGIESVLEDGVHYFPATGHASDVIAAFLHPARALGLILQCSSEVSEILFEGDRVDGVRLKTGDEYGCKALILACGGTAFSGLGGSRAGLHLAELAGHSIVTPAAAMAPLLTEEDWPWTLAGTTLPHAGLSFGTGRKACSTNGILLFTKEGVSGPAALDLSNPVHRLLLEEKEVQVFLNFDVTQTAQSWRERLESARKEDPKKLVRSHLANYFTHAMANLICGKTIGEEVRCGMLSNVMMEKLIRFLTGAVLTVKRPCPMEKAMAMSGGVSLKEVDPRTMGSRLKKGLFFAGEMLDLTGPCGGFNVQFALSSGRLAGASALKSLEKL